MILTDEQYTTLVHILHATKIDCWFSIRQGKSHGKLYDYCYDLANHKRLSLKTALTQAMDGFIGFTALGISEEEIHILDQILYGLGLIGEEELGNANGIKC